MGISNTFQGGLYAQEELARIKWIPWFYMSMLLFCYYYIFNLIEFL